MEWLNYLIYSIGAISLFFALISFLRFNEEPDSVDLIAMGILLGVAVICFK